MASIKIFQLVLTEAQWLLTDPVIEADMQVFSSDSAIPNNFKIGDGATAWSALPYVLQASEVLTAANAITKTGTVMRLGGALDANTDINTNGKALTIGADSTNRVQIGSASTDIRYTSGSNYYRNLTTSSGLLWVNGYNGTLYTLRLVNGVLSFTNANGIQTVITQDLLNAALALKANLTDLATKADLVNGLIPASQLPAYVDDVLEGEYVDPTEFFNPDEGVPYDPEAGKIYVDTTTNKSYRWTGAAFVDMSQGVVLGETSSTAHRGDHGAEAYTHSQITNGNPHGTTAADVGLGNVDNTSDVDKPISTAQAAVNATKAALDIAINTQTGNYTLALTDRGGLLRMNVAGANTVTIPTNAAVAFPVGTQIVISQAGAGQTAIAPFDGTVTLNSDSGKRKIATQYTAATLIKVATNTWLLLGNLAA